MFWVRIRGYLPLKLSQDLLRRWAACAFSPGLPFDETRTNFHSKNAARIKKKKMFAKHWSMAFSAFFRISIYQLPEVSFFFVKFLQYLVSYRIADIDVLIQYAFRWFQRNFLVFLILPPTHTHTFGEILSLFQYVFGFMCSAFCCQWNFRHSFKI